VLALLKDKMLMVDSVAVTADHIETPEEVAATIRSAMQYVDAE
jgi:methionine synthase II (cobalamin-independent)